jgi:CIC family chloride channel protein
LDRLKSWTAKALTWLDELRQHENQLAMVLSLVIGAIVGLVVVAFILLTGRLAAHLYPADGLAWRRVLVPVLGALISGFLLYRYFPEARGSGIPQTKAALYIGDGRITLHTVVGKFLCCSTSLASGIALGREGPSVQIGAGIASVLGRRLGLSRDQVKALIPVGGAAALAAAFNTPIAAVLFSLEEIVGDLHASVLGSVVLSSATAWIVLHLVLGDEPLFHVTAYNLVSPGEFAAYAVLGIVGGVASAAFTRLLLRLRRWFLDLPANSRWLQPVAGGLTVGAMGFFVPDVLGVGYPSVEKVLGGMMVLKIVIVLAVLKLVATAVCYASGNAGGIFGPSLFIGAMLGAAVGHLAHAVAPAHTAGVGAYALVGMGAVFAGVVRTPMTSVIMIFELTRDYSIIVPLMLSNLIAFFVSQRLQPAAIYEALAKQDGIHLPAHTAAHATRELRVERAMRSLERLVPDNLTISEVLARMLAGGDDCAVVLREGTMVLVAQADLEAAVHRGDGARPVGLTIAMSGDRSAPPDTAPPHLHLDHPLSLALQRMGESGREVLPVVSRSDIRILLGAITLSDVLERYHVSPRSAVAK